jgi:tetratricopeptide (TPR) repeat protein
MVDRPEWGGVARRGAATLGEGNATRAWRQAVNRAREDNRSGPDGAEASGDEWVRVDDVRDEATGAVARGETPSRSARATRGEADAELHPDAVDDVNAAVGARAAPRFEARLRDAARAFQRERWTDARRMLKSLSEQAPGSPAVRELYGLTFYRLGKWKDAVRELEAFRMLTGSSEQDAVLADCYRALGRYDEVERLWEELRAASPDADTVTEGRIVSAGALADQGELGRAIARLEDNRWKLPKSPKEHHLRRAYALADLLEAAGEVPRARDLFERVDRAAPELTDARARARALR